MNAATAAQLANATERAADAMERLARAERERFELDVERVAWTEAVNAAAATGGSRALASAAFFARSSTHDLGGSTVPATAAELVALFADSDPVADRVLRGDQ